MRFLWLCFALILCCLTARAATFTVTKTADTADGVCNADCSLREAIGAADAFYDVDEITFDATTFAAPQTITVGRLLSLSNSANITGPAAGVILRANPYDGSVPIMRIGAGAQVGLNRLTFSGGSTGIDNLGALNVQNCNIGPNINGINNNAALTLSNCTFSGNTNGVNNDSNFQSNSTVLASNCTFNNNRFGLYSYGDSVTVSDCTLKDNEHSGIALSGITGTLDVSNCALNGNESGIYFTAGTANVTNCTLSDNTYAGIYGAGGKLNLTRSTFKDTTIKESRASGISLFGADALVTGCTFRGIYRPYDAISPGSDSTLICANSTFELNGFAIRNASTDRVEAINCTFVGNAYGATNESGTLILTNCTLVGNHESIYTAGGPCTVANTIVADSYYEIPDNIIDSGHNIFGGTAAEAGLEVDGNGKAVLKDNGGPTFTVALVKRGPALNAGDDSVAPATDQRGIARPQGRASDIGAYEAVELSIGDVMVSESNDSTAIAVFPLLLSTPLTVPVSFNYATVDGSAKAGSDYNNMSGVITIAAGQTSGSITVPLIGDRINEANEAFYVLLSNPVGAVLAKGRGISTIVDNDPLAALSINDISLAEGNSGTRSATFTVQLNAPSGQVVSVDVASANGTAIAGADYQALPLTTIRFAPGQTQRTMTITVTGDSLSEANETFKLRLSNAQNATIADGQGSGTILDDDRAPALVISDASIVEGNPLSNGEPSTKNLRFTVNLSAPSGQSVSVNYATADGIARATSDYRAAGGTLTFAAGQTSRVIDIAINGDATVEGDETLFVLLSGAVNASIGRGRGTGLILNDDASG